MLHRLLQASLLLTVVASFQVRAAVGVSSAQVLAVRPTRVADLVLVGGGFEAGLREGMVCRVTRGATEIAEILLVELRPSCGAALIVNLTPKQSIRAGDLASVKVLKS